LWAITSPFWRSVVEDDDVDKDDAATVAAALPLRCPMPKEMLMPPTRFCATVVRNCNCCSSVAASLLLVVVLVVAVAMAVVVLLLPLLLLLLLEAAALLPTLLVAFKMFLIAAAALTGDCWY